MDDDISMTLRCPNCSAKVILKPKKTGMPFSEIAKCVECDLEWFWSINDAIDESEE